MKHAVKTLCLATLMVGLAFGANAQFRQSVFLNGNLPTGNFGQSVSDNHTTVPLTYEEVGKAAAFGFGLGYRASYRFDVGVGMVAPFLQVDVLWNTISNTWNDKYLNDNLTAPTYFNFPLMAGVSYLYDQLWNDITPYGEFGVGADMLWITSEGKPASQNNGTLYYAYNPSFAMSWMLGAGAYFGRHVSVGVYYYGLGKHAIDYTSATLSHNSVAQGQLETNNQLNHGRETRTVGSLAIRIGFHF